MIAVIFCAFFFDSSTIYFILFYHFILFYFIFIESQNHRIIEWLGLERASRITKLQPPCQAGPPTSPFARQEGKYTAIKMLGKRCKISVAESTSHATKSWNKELASLKCDKHIFIAIKSMYKRIPQRIKGQGKAFQLKYLKK